MFVRMGRTYVNVDAVEAVHVADEETVEVILRSGAAFEESMTVDALEEVLHRMVEETSET